MAPVTCLDRYIHAYYPGKIYTIVIALGFIFPSDGIFLCYEPGAGTTPTTLKSANPRIQTIADILTGKKRYNYTRKMLSIVEQALTPPVMLSCESNTQSTWYIQALSTHSYACCCMLASSPGSPHCTYFAGSLTFVVLSGNMAGAVQTESPNLRCGDRVKAFYRVIINDEIYYCST